MKSIRIKLVFWICVLFIFIGGLIYIPLSFILPQKITAQILKRDLEIAKYVSKEATNFLLLNDRIALSILLHDNLEKLEDAQYLFVQEPNGKILAHTFGKGFPKDLLNFNRTASTYKIKEFLNNGRRNYDIAIPIVEGRVGTLHLGVSLESGKKDIAEIKKINHYVAVIILIGLGIGILIFLIIGLLFSNQIIQLKDFAASIGQGGLEKKITIKSNDEIGVLASVLNEMTIKLKKNIQEIKKLNIIEERNRIALDLHDGYAQDMANIIKRIELTKKLFRINPPQALEELDSLKGSTQDVLNKTRQLIFDLKSPENVEFNFLDTLTTHVESYKKTNDINVNLNISGSLNNIPKEKLKTIFYIIAESLSNIRKHSMAKNVSLCLESNNNDNLIINIRDDGKGFDVDNTLLTAGNYGRLGLISIQERATYLKGFVTINSAPNQGTNISLNIPITAGG